MPKILSTRSFCDPEFAARCALFGPGIESARTKHLVHRVVNAHDDLFEAKGFVPGLPGKEPIKTKLTKGQSLIVSFLTSRMLLHNKFECLFQDSLFLANLIFASKNSILLKHKKLAIGYKFCRVQTREYSKKIVFLL
jgi:hypothetical protein